MAITSIQATIIPHGCSRTRAMLRASVHPGKTICQDRHGSLPWNAQKAGLLDATQQPYTETSYDGKSQQLCRGTITLSAPYHASGCCNVLQDMQELCHRHVLRFSWNQKDFFLAVASIQLGKSLWHHWPCQCQSDPGERRGLTAAGAGESAQMAPAATCSTCCGGTSCAAAAASSSAGASRITSTAAASPAC